MKYQGKVEFKTQPRKVWDTVLDMEQFVACFPGVEDIEMVDDKTFTGAMKAKVGPVSGDFAFQAQIVEADEPTHLKAEVEGKDSLTNSTMTAEITMDLSPLNDDTELSYFSEVKIKGRLAIIGDMVIRATGAQVIEEFFKRLRERVEA
ncbi:MAG: carbon monoxide dehydrogenase subunit G [Dehalococcoidia bacterium]|jgi:carbon monoxide dehydrogenase subunit G|nr:carbon monoxide dehydrogenase subunit G [Dehalococcoidia bacterium]|tara:strand:+ start:541 stop:984 length:444 start_codon:yes stop_codon:yes gene_type:complete